MAIWYARQQGNAAGGWSAANPAAQGGLLANASGSLGLFGGVATAVVIPPVARTITVVLYDHLGSLLLGQDCKVMQPTASGSSEVTIGLSTSDLTTGVLSFTRTIPPTDHVPLYFTGAYSVLGVEYTYRSEMLTPA